MEIERSLIAEDWFEYARLYPYHSVKGLILPIKKKWFDMIQSKKKKEEYREIKPYYISRLRNSGFLDSSSEPRKEFFRIVTFRNGYHKDSPSLDVICSLDIKEGKPEWGAEPGKLYYCLEKRILDSENRNDWRTSELRQWLNFDFFNKVFDFEEKSFLMPYFGDKVNLLNVEEAERYFRSQYSRKATDLIGKYQWWWLRSRGMSGLYAAIVDTYGIVDCKEDYALGSVRPVIYLKKDVENYLEPEG